MIKPIINLLRSIWTNIRSEKEKRKRKSRGSVLLKAQLCAFLRFSRDLYSHSSTCSNQFDRTTPRSHRRTRSFSPSVNAMAFWWTLIVLGFAYAICRLLLMLIPPNVPSIEVDASDGDKFIPLSFYLYIWMLLNSLALPLLSASV